MGSRCILLVIVLLAQAALACSAGLSTEGGEPDVDLQAAPLVLLLAPVNGSLYAEGTRVELYAIAQESLAGVSRIEFRVDDLPVGDVEAVNPEGQPSLEARHTWTATGKQGHLITVEAFRADGSSLGLNEVTVTVTDKPGAATPAGGGDASPGVTTNQPGSATAVPTPTGAPDLTPPVNDMGILSATGVMARVNTSSLNIRQGPGTNYPTVGTLYMGDRVPIVGHNADSTWWAVSYGGGTGWLLASLIITEGDASQVPLVAAPPP